MAKGSSQSKKKMISRLKIKRRGAPPKDPEDRLDRPRTIKFNEELELRLRAMASEEKGSKAINSLVRRLCEEGIEEWMNEKGYTAADIIKIISR